MDKKQIETLLRGIIAKHLPNVSPEAIALGDALANLGIDSLAFSWILVDMEDTFDLEMQGGDVLKIKTLEAAVAYVEARLAR